MVVVVLVQTNVWQKLQQHKHGSWWKLGSFSCTRACIKRLLRPCDTHHGAIRNGHAVLYAVLTCSFFPPSLFSVSYLRPLPPRPSLSSFVEAVGLQFEREVLRKGVLLKYNAIITVTVTQLYRLAKPGDVATVGCSLPYFNT